MPGAFKKTILGQRLTFSCQFDDILQDLKAEVAKVCADKRLKREDKQTILIQLFADAETKKVVRAHELRGAQTKQRVVAERKLVQKKTQSRKDDRLHHEENSEEHVFCEKEGFFKTPEYYDHINAATEVPNHFLDKNERDLFV